MRTRSALVVRLALLTAVLAGSTLVVGCDGNDATPGSAAAGSSTAGGDGATGAPATEPVTEPVADEDAADFPADTSTDTAEASSEARVTVRDIRIGRHDGFDRVVFEVGGTGTPGWDVRYVDDPSSQGSGDPVEVEGDAALQVTVTGAGYPYETGVAEYTGTNPLAVAGTGVVTEVAFDATYEGATVSFVGTANRTPFRVYLLEMPTRVVVEVTHPT
jgi:hypothetical protein